MPPPARKPVIGHVLHRMDYAGAEVLAADLARRLQGEFDTVFLCLDAIGQLGKRLMGEGFKVVDLRRRPGVDAAAAWRIRKAVRRYGINLLHAHQYTPFFYAALSRGLSERPRLLFTEHGRHYPDRRHPRRVLANRFLLRPDDRVTAVGAFVRRALIDHEGIEGGRIDVILNGIDPAGFPIPTPAARAAVRAELGLADTDRVVMQVARLHPVKDHGTAIRAFARAHDRLPDARLVLIGEGPRRKRIQRLAWEQGVADHVHLLGVREDVARLLHAADVFLLSSLSEGISVTLLEAMAAGLPIIATDVGGNPEVVRHGLTGLLAQRRDSRTLADHLTVLLSEPGTARALGQAGRNRVYETFTQQAMHDRYAQVYRAMVS